jgi:hypothetical protein
VKHNLVCNALYDVLYDRTVPGKELRGLHAKSSEFIAMIRSSGMPSPLMV